MRFRLATPLAPRRPHGAPALAAQRADDPAGVACAQQRMTEQALRGEEKLF